MVASGRRDISELATGQALWLPNMPAAITEPARVTVSTVSEPVATGEVLEADTRSRLEKYLEQRHRLMTGFNSCSERELAALYKAIVDCDDRIEALGVEVEVTRFDDIAARRAKRIAEAHAQAHAAGAGN